MSIATIFGEEPRWAFMWQLAFAIYVGFKALTWWTTPAVGVSLRRRLGYLIAWPGLDAKAFFDAPCLFRPSLRGWLFAVSKLLLGIVLIAGVYPRLHDANEVVRGWVGMLGVVFVLHFGVFHLLSLAWQSVGVSARPLMDWPILAASVSDFWGNRWNRAFRDLTHRYLFRPLTARFGAKVALVLGFLFSGIIHDLIISVPAGGGYGGPTAFFLLQAAAVFGERSALGQRLGLGHDVRGWAFVLVVLLGPALLLFHPPFVRNVAVPFLDYLTQ
jgi:hypothetical protein